MPGNRLPCRILDCEPKRARRKGNPKEKWMDGWMDGVRRTKYWLTEEDNGDGVEKKLVEGKPL
jgi:hypothetical protein